MEWTSLNYEPNPIVKTKPLKVYTHCTPNIFVDFIESQPNGLFTMRDFSKFRFNTDIQKQKKQEYNIHPKTTYEEFLPKLYEMYGGDEKGVKNYLKLKFEGKCKTKNRKIAQKGGKRIK